MIQDKYLSVLWCAMLSDWYVDVEVLSNFVSDI